VHDVLGCSAGVSAVKIRGHIWTGPDGLSCNVHGAGGQDESSNRRVRQVALAQPRAHVALRVRRRQTADEHASTGLVHPRLILPEVAKGRFHSKQPRRANHSPHLETSTHPHVHVYSKTTWYVRYAISKPHSTHCSGSKTPHKGGSCQLSQLGDTLTHKQDMKVKEGIGSKTPGGAGTHTGHAGHTDHTETNLTTIPTAIQGVLPMCRWLGKLQSSLSNPPRRTRTTTLPVNRHRGEPGHTRDTRTHTGTRITQTNLTTIRRVEGTGRYL
jgi:hypothetical protein